MRRMGIIVLALALAAACSGGHEGVNEKAVGKELQRQIEEGVAKLPACDEQWAPGGDTAKLVAADQDGCRDADGEVRIYGAATQKCPDGRTLVWNDRGWGYEPGKWQAHARDDGQLVPPQVDLDACPG